MSLSKVTLKYSTVSSFTLAQAAQKLSATPTDGRAACRIRNVFRVLTDVRNKISKEYQAEIVQTFAKKNEAGEVIRPEGNPNGFDPVEAKEEEFLKAQEEFGKKEITFDCIPLTLSEIKDVKLSAQELEALGDLFVEALPGPGVPENVTSIR